MAVLGLMYEEWIAFIRNKDNYSEDSYRDETCWGSTTHGFTFSGGEEKSNGLDVPSTEYQLDMMIDCDKGEIKIGFVEHWKDQDIQEIALTGLPNNPKGWMPHFNIYDSNAWLRILRIDPSLFRMHSPFADEMFGLWFIN